MSKNQIVNFRVTDYKLVESDDIIDTLANVGPLAVVLEPPPISYKDGILSDADDNYCSIFKKKTTIHAALIVGYNSTNDAFTIKNSWGSSW